MTEDIEKLGHWTGSTCPFCGKPKHLAGTLRSDNPPPSPNDAAICISCGNWAIFTERLELRRPSITELVELSENEDVQRATEIWKTMDREMRRRH